MLKKFKKMCHLIVPVVILMGCSSNFSVSGEALNSAQITSIVACPDPGMFVSTIEFPSTEELTANSGEADVVQSPNLRFDCDPRDWLVTVVQEVTSDSPTNLTKAVAWTTWLQRNIGHSCLPPEDENGQTVYHPIYLLQNRKMHCGQVARLVVDGLTTLGIPARVLQMKGHVSSEFFVDGRWILAEADILSDGQFLRSKLGEFVGIDDVKLDPSILTSVKPYLEESCWTLLSPDEAAKLMEAHNLSIGIDVGAGNLSVWIETFGQANYGDSLRGSWITPFVIKKTATTEQELDSQYFGWNYYEFCSRETVGCTN